MRTPIDMGDLLSEIEVPDIGSAQLALQDIQRKNEPQDLFAEQKRKDGIRRWKRVATSHRARA